MSLFLVLFGGMAFHPSSDATVLAFEVQQQEMPVKQHGEIRFVSIYNNGTLRFGRTGTTGYFLMYTGF